MNELARGVPVTFEPGIADPVGEAIAAEAGQPHQLDILRIVAMLQMPHQAAESGCGDRVGKRVQRVRNVLHTYASFNGDLSCHIAVP